MGHYFPSIFGSDSHTPQSSASRSAEKLYESDGEAGSETSQATVIRTPTKKLLRTGAAAAAKVQYPHTDGTERWAGSGGTQFANYSAAGPSEVGPSRPSTPPPHSYDEFTQSPSGAYRRTDTLAPVEGYRDDEEEYEEESNERVGATLERVPELPYYAIGPQHKGKVTGSRSKSRPIPGASDGPEYERPGTAIGPRAPSRAFREVGDDTPAGYGRAGTAIDPAPESRIIPRRSRAPEDQGGEAIRDREPIFQAYSGDNRPVTRGNVGTTDDANRVYNPPLGNPRSDAPQTSGKFKRAVSKLGVFSKKEKEPYQVDQGSGSMHAPSTTPTMMERAKNRMRHPLSSAPPRQQLFDQSVKLLQHGSKVWKDSSLVNIKERYYDIYHQVSLELQKVGDRAKQVGAEKEFEEARSEIGSRGEDLLRKIKQNPFLIPQNIDLSMLASEVTNVLNKYENQSMEAINGHRTFCFERLGEMASPFTERFWNKRDEDMKGKVRKLEGTVEKVRQEAQAFGAQSTKWDEDMSNKLNKIKGAAHKHSDGNAKARGFGMSEPDDSMNKQEAELNEQITECTRTLDATWRDVKKLKNMQAAVFDTSVKKGQASGPVA